MKNKYNIQFNKNEKILIQSMTNTKTHNVASTMTQINDLIRAGVDLVRVAIFDESDIVALKEIVKLSNVPIIADIHFNYKFAIAAINAGVFKIRLNPGNINKESEISQIIKAAIEKDVYIRIGVNCGSLPKDIEEKYGISVQGMIKTLDRYLTIFEKYNFKKIVISLKSSDPILNIKVNEAADKKYNFPIHIGVTEAGSYTNAIIKSTIGLTPLLQKKIGDTIRISISDNPVVEIEVANKLLNILKIKNDMIDIISCPTCGRLDYDLFKIIKKTEEYCKDKKFPLKISILGCVVNGIGEAKNADIGIAGSSKKGIVFENGKILKTVPEKDLFKELKKLIDIKYKEFLNQK